MADDDAVRCLTECAIQYIRARPRVPNKLRSKEARYGLTIFTQLLLTLLEDGAAILNQMLIILIFAHRSSCPGRLGAVGILKQFGNVKQRLDIKVSVKTAVYLVNDHPAIARVRVCSRLFADRPTMRAIVAASCSIFTLAVFTVLAMVSVTMGTPCKFQIWEQRLRCTLATRRTNRVLKYNYERQCNDCSCGT